MTLQQAPFVDRDNFGRFLNERGLVGEAVEVGTHRAEFASQFLYLWRGETLWCVDHWLPGYDPIDTAALGDRRADRLLALSRLVEFGERAVVLGVESGEAAGSFADFSLDFVYVDACHQYEAVFRDLAMWWPKVKKGGILAGHDFLCHPPDRWHQFIQPAVMNFAANRGLDVFLVVETMSQPWSYYLEKKE